MRIGSTKAQGMAHLFRSARLDIIKLRDVPSGWAQCVAPGGHGWLAAGPVILARINRATACSNRPTQSLLFRRQNVEMKSF